MREVTAHILLFTGDRRCGLSVFNVISSSCRLGKELDEVKQRETEAVRKLETLCGVAQQEQLKSDAQVHARTRACAASQTFHMCCVRHDSDVARVSLSKLTYHFHYEVVSDPS